MLEDDLKILRDMASYMVFRFPDILELDELVNEGWIGLCDIRRKGTYISNKGEWEPYAKKCIIRFMLTAITRQRQHGIRGISRTHETLEYEEYEEKNHYESNQEENIKIETMMDELLVKMKKCLLVLEYMIIKGFFFDNMTLVEIGAKHDLSRQRVEQLLNRAIKILKENQYRPKRLS